MTAFTRPNHPFRLGAMAAAGAIAAWLVVMAVISVRYIVQDQRDNAVSRVAGVSDAPGANVDTPKGVIIVTPVESAAAFEELTGFAPFVPQSLPASTEPEPSFAVGQPDPLGNRVGRVAFSAREGWSAYGISGPVIVIGQAQGEPGVGVDGLLKRIKGGGRALAATMECGDLVLDVQMYFSPDAQADEPIVTPYMHTTATNLLDGISEQCGE